MKYTDTPEWEYDDEGTLLISRAWLNHDSRGKAASEVSLTDIKYSRKPSDLAPKVKFTDEDGKQYILKDRWPEGRSPVLLTL